METITLPCLRKAEWGDGYATRAAHLCGGTRSTLRQALIILAPASSTQHGGKTYFLGQIKISTCIFCHLFIYEPAAQ